MRALLFLTALLLAPPIGGQAAPEPSPEDPAAEEGAPEWTGALSVYSYFVPGDRNYAQPTVRADRGRLHLEARWNYEDLDTASLWAGANFAGGEELWWELTPMVGAVFGESNGVGPGYEGAVGWWRLELYSEGEYVFDTDDSDDSYFYTWTELTIAALDWLRAGFVTQRTRAYETDLDTQRGFTAGVTWRRWDATITLLNLDESDPTVVVSLALEF